MLLCHLWFVDDTGSELSRLTTKICILCSFIYFFHEPEFYVFTCRSNRDYGYEVELGSQILSRFRGVFGNGLKGICYLPCESKFQPNCPLPYFSLNYKLILMIFKLMIILRNFIMNNNVIVCEKNCYLRKVIYRPKPVSTSYRLKIALMP